MGDLTEEELEKVKEARLIFLLREAKIADESCDDTTLLELYHESLEVSQIGYKILHKRDVAEICVNNYNPEWIINWNGNMDLQLCLDYYAVITYISDYYSKDDSGTLQYIKEALKQSGDESLKSKLSLVAHTFMTHRQIGECEAYFRIIPHLNLK